MLCHTENIAPGTLAAAMSAKCLDASVHARPEFCMPTSIEIATHFVCVKRSARPIMYPNPNPHMLCSMTTSNTTSPTSFSCSEFADTIIPTMTPIAIADTPAMYSDAASAIRGIHRLTPRPVITGSSTTASIDLNMSTTDTSTYVPANKSTIIGVRIGARSVDTPVMPTDNAKSPFAMKVITLDAVPPGHAPTSITPTAKSAGSENTFANMYAMSGMIVNCAMQPSSKSNGRENVTLKSDTVNVMPMPSMTTPSNGVTTFADAHPNVHGHINAIVAHMMTMSAVCSLIVFIFFFFSPPLYVRSIAFVCIFLQVFPYGHLSPQMSNILLMPYFLMGMLLKCNKINVI